MFDSNDLQSAIAMLFPAAPPLPDGFPIRTFRIGVLAMIAIVVVSALLTYRIEQNIRSAMQEELRLTSATDVLEDHGSTLGFAIRAAVTNGDLQAIAQYHASLTVLRRAMGELRASIGNPELHRVAQHVENVDRWLVGQELRAIALVRAGRSDEAQRIIDDPVYQRAAESYFDSLARIEDHADQRVRHIERDLDLHLLALMAITTASIFLVAIAWLSFVRPARRWGLELQSARSRIEASLTQLRQSQRELAEKNRELFRQARIDCVTALQTRLQLAEDIGNPWASTGELGQPSFALLCDIDRFRLYNRLHGHSAGDKLLRLVAEALKSCCRPGEQAYRLGGDQVLILSRAPSLGEAVGRAEELRRAVEQLRHPHDPAAQQTVTVSIGVAGLDARGELHMERWLTRAGDALAEAKRTGRNAVSSGGGRLARAI